MNNPVRLFVACCILSLTASGCRAQQSDGPKEVDIRGAFLKIYFDRSADGTQIKFDAAILVAPAVQGDVTPVIGKPVYPVKVNFSELCSYPTRTVVTHWTGGVYNFYKDPFGTWQFYTATPATSKNESIPK